MEPINRELGGTTVPHYIISITHSNTTLPNFQSHWSCDNCQAEFPHDLIHGKLAKFEAEIENIKSSEPEEFEKLKIAKSGKKWSRYCFFNVWEFKI